MSNQFGMPETGFTPASTLGPPPIHGQSAPITLAINTLEKTLSDLQAALNRLETAVTPALSEAESKQPGQAEAPTPGSSPLARSVTLQTDRVRALLRQVDAIHNELEL